PAQGRRGPAGQDHPADAARAGARRPGRDGGTAGAQRRPGRAFRQGHRDDRAGSQSRVPGARGGAGRRRVSAPLWLLALITFSGTLAMHIFVPALPEAARDLGAGVGTMQLTMSVYILGLALGQLAYGPLSDRFARLPVLIAAPVLHPPP